MAAEGPGKLPVVAIIGRPNVGKSTLFNRLTHSRRALVHDQPGVTRDRLYGFAYSSARQFLMIDTGGLTDSAGTIAQTVRLPVEAALLESNVSLWILDASGGLTSADIEVGREGGGAEGRRRGEVAAHAAPARTPQQRRHPPSQARAHPGVVLVAEQLLEAACRRGTPPACGGPGRGSGPPWRRSRRPRSAHAASAAAAAPPQPGACTRRGYPARAAADGGRVAAADPRRI